MRRRATDYNRIYPGFFFSPDYYAYKSYGDIITVVNHPCETRKEKLFDFINKYKKKMHKRLLLLEKKKKIRPNYNTFTETPTGFIIRFQSFRYYDAPFLILTRVQISQS